MISKELLKYTAEKVEKFFKKFPVPAHDFEHVKSVVKYAKAIAQKEKEDAGLAETAAWLHDIGRVNEHNYNPRGLSHQELSFGLTSEWFEKDRRFFTLSEREKEEILYAVRNHGNDAAQDYPSAVILRDADKLDLWGEEGLRRHIEFNKNEPEILPISLVFNIERAKRLTTKSAKMILRKREMIKPLRNFLIQQEKKRIKVLCALSGGVDSAVAAALLQKAGYQVTGAFIKCYDDAKTPNYEPRLPAGGDEAAHTGNETKSCWIEERRDALRVAAKLGIKLITLNFEKEYQRDVIDYLYREYQAGLTPNPDVMCNKYVKIPLLIREAKKLGFDYVATGHYARRRREIPNSQSSIPNKSKFPNFKFKLLRAADKNKDQTYFLHQLGQKELKYLFFPLAKLCKDEVRILAKEWRLPVADKEESMGICFVGEVPIKKFLKKKIKPRPGKIVLSDGTAVGEHEGLAFYTIGQREGLSGRYWQAARQSSQVRQGGCHAFRARDDGRPLYVVGKDIKNNRLIVGYGNDPLLYKKEIIVKNINWIAGAAPPLPLRCFARSRHRQELQEARITKCEPGSANQEARILIKFKVPQRAVSPGQFAVIYQKDGECLGGGEIN